MAKKKGSRMRKKSGSSTGPDVKELELGKLTEAVLKKATVPELKVFVEELGYDGKNLKKAEYIDYIMEKQSESGKEPELTDAVSEVIGTKDKKKEKKIPKKYNTMLLKWTADGYEVSELEELMETGSTKQVRERFIEFEDAVEKVEDIKLALGKMDTVGLESDMDDLNDLLTKPLNFDEINSRFEELKNRKRTVDIHTELDKMVLPTMKDRVESLKRKLSDPAQVDSVEKELAKLKMEYKEKYFTEGIVSDVKPTAEPTVKPAAKKKTPMVVKDVFLLYKDGRFISHHTNRVVSKEEQARLYADLKTGKSFLRNPKYVPHKLNSIALNGRNILVQSGHFTVVIVLTEGSVDPWTERIVNKVLTLMEKEDLASLRNWDGDVSSLKSSGKYMQALLFACMKLSKKGAVTRP